MALEDELRSLFADDRLALTVKPGADTEIVAGARRVRRRRTAVTTAFVLALFGAGGVAVANLGGTPTVPSATDGSSITTVPSSPATAAPPTVVITRTETMTVTVNEPEPPASSRAPVAAAGYGKLKLGMPQQEALATGVLVEPQIKVAGPCAPYRSESVAADDAVLVSPTRGVVRISLPSFAKTSAGIGAGATVAEVKAKYPAAVRQESAFVVDMGDWRYVFTVDAERVIGIRMELENTDCV